MSKLSNLEKQQIQEVADPIWKNIILAARNKDYARFSRGFSADLRAKLSEEHFDDSCRESPLLTSITSNYKFIDLISRSNGITILWRVYSDQFDGEFLGQLTLMTSEKGMEVAGVYIS